jgi:hypothetical protein
VTTSSLSSTVLNSTRSPRLLSLLPPLIASVVSGCMVSLQRQATRMRVLAGCCARWRCGPAWQVGNTGCSLGFVAR